MNKNRDIQWIFKPCEGDELLRQLLEECEQQLNDCHWFFYCRPSRLPWVRKLKHPSHEKKRLLEQENTRLLSALQLNYYTEKPCFLKELPEITELPRKGVFVPLVNETSLPDMPQVSFSPFEKNTNCSLMDGENKYKNIIKILKDKGKISGGMAYQLCMDNFQSIDGRSFELGYFVHAWLETHKSDYTNPPKIICTGCIDKEGNITAVNHTELKLEAALTKDSDYILLPLENRPKDFETNSKVLYFSHVYSVINWLRENTDIKLNQKAIKAWLNGDKTEPSPKQFESFFQQSLGDNKLTQWKNMLAYKPLELQISQLKKLISKYIEYIKTASKLTTEEKIDLYFMLLPAHYTYFLLPDLLAKEMENPQLYHRLADNFSDHNQNITLASFKILETDFINTVNHEQHDKSSIENLLERYPKLVYLLFKNPVQLLQLLTSLPKLQTTTRYRMLLDKLINLLNQCDGKKILTDKNYEKNFEIDVINQLLAFENETTKLTDINLIRNSQKLALLFHSYHNLNFREMVREAEVIFRYFIKLLDLVTRNKEDKIDLEHIKSQFKNPSNSLDKNCFSMSGLKKLYKVILAYNTDQKTTKENNSYTKQKDKLIQTSKALLCTEMQIPLGFPQPALNIYYQLTNLSPNDKLSIAAKTLNKVAKQMLKGTPSNSREATEFLCESLQFWAATLVHKNMVKKLNENSILNTTMPFFIGLHKRYYAQQRCTQKQGCTLKNYLTNNNHQNHRQLLWLHCLKKQCRDCLFPNLKEKMEISLAKQSGNDAARQRINLLFLWELLEFKPEQKEWQQLVKDYEKNPLGIRRTAQLLVPIYLVLRLGKSSEEFIANDHKSLNSSHFILEVLRQFGSKAPLERLFVPKQWQSSLSEQSFNTLAICELRNNPVLLQKYLMQKVKDLPNLLLGFSLLS